MEEVFLSNPGVWPVAGSPWRVSTDGLVTVEGRLHDAFAAGRSRESLVNFVLSRRGHVAFDAKPFPSEIWRFRAGGMLNEQAPDGVEGVCRCFELESVDRFTHDRPGFVEGSNCDQRCELAVVARGRSWRFVSDIGDGPQCSR